MKTEKQNKPQDQTVCPFDLPTNWEACSREELEWLRANGSYMQRVIAGRWLASLTAGGAQ